jgi:hypothetical protein
VDLLDFSVEHLSWLERRIGLRYLTGALKTVALLYSIQIVIKRDSGVLYYLKMVTPFWTGASLRSQRINFDTLLRFV